MDYASRVYVPNAIGNALELISLQVSDNSFSNCNNAYHLEETSFLSLLTSHIVVGFPAFLPKRDKAGQFESSGLRNKGNSA